MASEHESSSLLSPQQVQALRSHNPVKQFLEIARNHPVLSERVRGAGLCLAARRVTYAPYGLSVSPTWWSDAGAGRRHRQEQRRPCSLQGARSFLVQAEQPWAKPEPSGWDRFTALGRACGRRCWQNSSAWPYSSCMEAGAVCRPPALAPSSVRLRQGLTHAASAAAVPTMKWRPLAMASHSRSPVRPICICSTFSAQPAAAAESTELPCSLCDRQCVGRPPQPSGHVCDLPDWPHVVAARRPVLRGAAAGRHLRRTRRGAVALPSVA